MTATFLSSPREKLGTERITLPSEILLYIFNFAVNHFDPSKASGPSIDLGNDSPWSKDLRMKKALVHVCNSWRIIAMPLLYHRVYLHRVGQLCALVKVLEDSSRGHDGTGYSFWVRHVHGRFLVPTSWETVYYKNIICLLALCTSTRSFSWAIEWGSPSPRQSGSGHPMLAQYSTINLLRHSQPSMLPIFNSLQKLAFTLDESSQQQTKFFDVKDTLVFQNLEDLTCEATEAKFLEGLAVVSQSFLMPKLQHLAINVPSWGWGYITDLQVTSIFGLLESHGEKLSSLALGFPITTKIRLGVVNILQCTPNLRALKCFTRALRPIDTKTVTATHVSNLEKLELFTSEDNISSSNSGPGLHSFAFEQFLVMSSSRKIFPSLRTIAIFGESSPSLPLDSVLVPSDHKEAYAYLTAWTKKFREMGVSLIGVDDVLIAPENPGPGRWTGRNATNEDDEWDEEEDEHTDSEDLHQENSFATGLADIL